LRKDSILSFGVNQNGDDKGIVPGIHAECDAINKLIPNKNKKHFKQINIMVIRLSKKNKLQSSKPCAYCIENMKILPQKKGYIIKNIYYSDENENIVKTTIKDLENEDLHYSRFFNRKRAHITSE